MSAHAQHQNVWLVAMSVSFIVAAQFAFISRLREPVVIGGEALVTYGAMRAALLTILKRRQYRFEPAWLAGQSAVLRNAEFQVIRFIFNNRMYDLGDPNAVRELFRHIDDDGRVTLDIAYASSAFERIYPHLRNMQYRAVLRAGAIPRAQFPEAHYGLRPSGMATYWVLGGLVILTVAAPGGPATPRGGTGSRRRPGGECRVDERLRGTP